MAAYNSVDFVGTSLSNLASKENPNLEEGFAWGAFGG